MKRAAFLSFDWNYVIMSEYYEGMKAYLDEHAGTQLVIFNAFGSYASYQYEEGACEIFSLCDPEDYDGFIIQGNRAWPPEMRQRVADEILALHKPVVSINYELKGTHYVGTDNYQAMYGLVHKVLAEKSCKRPAFVNGLATSVEARARAKAYRDACAMCFIEEPRFYQANWEMEEGAKAALKMLEDRDNLPDVIFCANDDLAVGVQETLQEHGVRVPEDVKVSGFDNREISLKASPRITTVDRDYHTVGRTAMEALDALMDGELQPMRITSPARYIFSESCGFQSEAESIDSLAESLYSIDFALKHFYEVLTNFQPAVLNADTLNDILRECERYFPEVRCPNVYLMLNDEYLEHDAAHAVTAYGAVSLLVAHSGAGVRACCDDSHVYLRFPTRELLPQEVPMSQPVHMVFPLRQGTTCLGFFVTEGVSPILRYGFLTIILTLLAGSIESVRKKEMLQRVNSRLDELYVRDQLTGLFNRFGLDRFGVIAYEHLLRDFDGAQFIFVDVDNMKQINDVYGHEAGDRALQDTADIINHAIKDENAFAMRYGGDEFLLICRRDITDKLQAELERLKRGVHRSFDLSLSIGAFQVLRSDHYTVQEAIERADARMYEIKKARKTLRP